MSERRQHHVDAHNPRPRGRRAFKLLACTHRFVVWPPNADGSRTCPDCKVAVWPDTDAERLANTEQARRILR